MRIISHRGNLTGPDKTRENTEAYLIEALEKGFDVEFDLWCVADKFWLGHDFAEHAFSLDTLLRWSTVYSNQKLYVHCKNIWALEKMIKIEKGNIVPFFHDADQCILLKVGTIWVHPKAIHSVSDRKNSIAVYSTCKSLGYDVNLDLDFQGFYGICTDYPLVLRNGIK